MRKQYLKTSIFERIYPEESIQLPTTNNIEYKSDYLRIPQKTPIRVPNNQKELG
jgi:hypothetical protein